MRSVLKLLLLACLLLAGIYAATPLWLSHALNSQLPSGWQLQSLQSGYPGISGIDIHSMQLDGKFQAANVELTTTGFQFSYRDLKSQVESITLSVYMNDAGDTITDRFSLPIMNPMGQLPEVSVEQIHLILHHQRDGTSKDADALKPLELVLDAFRLSPQTNGNINIGANVAVKSIPAAAGQLELVLGADSQVASIRFPTHVPSNDWLLVKAEQVKNGNETSTSIQASFDSEFANQQWLDTIFSRASGGLIQHAEGTLNMHASYAGVDLQHLEDLSLSTEKLSLMTPVGFFDLNTALTLSRDKSIFLAHLSAPTELQYRDETGELDRVLTRVLPALQRVPRPRSLSLLTLQTGSHFSINPADTPSVQFSGGIDFKLNSPAETIGIQSDEIQATMAKWPMLDSISADGDFQFELKEETPLNYEMETVKPKVASASISARIQSRDGLLLSTGRGTFTHANLQSLATSSEQIDLQWHDFDILSRNGHFTAQTEGFTSSIDDEIWENLDFDVSFDLVNGEKVKGAGNVIVHNGPILPVIFNGNTSEEKWNVSLPPYTIEFSELGSLLSVAHLDLPPAVTFSDGSLTLQAQVEIGNDTVVTIASQAHELDASLRETNADDIGFSFEYRLDSALSGGGPISIESVALAGGLELHHLKASLQAINSKTFDIQDLYAELLGGQLSLSSLRFNDKRIENTQLELSHLDLDLLLTFAHIDGLSGSGIMDISLPVISDEKGIAIKQGTFRATGPGRLSYVKAGVSATNIGLQALENFQYESLSGTIDYQADGTYHIAARIEGNNPDMYDGYPVAFNLNINGSLPELFEALFISGNFGKAMLKVIRKQ